MPTYDYQCRQCDFLFEKKLPMSEYQVPETEACPECKEVGKVEQVIVSAPAIGDPIRLGIKRPDSGWGDVLKKVKAAHPKAKLGQKYAPTAGI